MRKVKTIFCLSIVALALAACNNSPSSSSSSSSSSTSSSNWQTVPAVSKSTEAEENNSFAVAAKNSGKLANGYKDFTSVIRDSDPNDEAELVSILEDYALTTFIAGIPYMDDGGKVMYSSRLTPASDRYITNFGYGVLFGTINEPMTATQEPTEKYRWYYHTYLNSQPDTAFAAEGEDSNVSDVASYNQAVWYDIKLKEDGTGYEWYSSLAAGLPVGVSGSAEAGYTSFKVKLRDDAKWATTSTTYERFNGTPITLADVECSFRSLLTQKYGLFRATELFNDSLTVTGAKTFYDTTANDIGTDEAWKRVGFNFDYANNEFTISTEKSYSVADFMIQLSSTIFAPLNSDFVTAIGGGNFETGLSRYGTRSLGADGILSSGPFILEAWDNTHLAFAKNTSFYDADLYSIQGVKLSIIETLATAFQQFLNGQLDACSIPADQLSNYINDPRTRSIPGSSVLKFNVNALTQDQWNSRFGDNGYVSQSSDNSYTVKPLMSNLNFLNGLYYAIDRAELAATFGLNPAQAFYGDAYTLDETNDVQYRETDYAKAVISKRNDLDPSTPGEEAPLGHSVSVAQAYFRNAVNQEIDKGTMKAGDTVTLTTLFGTSDQVTRYGSYFEKYFETTFNEANVATGVTLNLDISAPAEWGVYDRMEAGTFDLGYGAITGMSLNPVGFAQVLCSDNRSSFTLSHAYNTAVVDSRLQYKGEYYSFDALYSAGANGALISDGKETSAVTITSQLCTKEEIGFVLNLTNAGGYSAVVTGVTLYDGAAEDGWGIDAAWGASGLLDEVYDPTTKTISISKAAAAAIGFDVDDYTAINVVIYYAYEDAEGNLGAESYIIVPVVFVA